MCQIYAIHCRVAKMWYVSVGGKCDDTFDAKQNWFLEHTRRSIAHCRGSSASDRLSDAGINPTL